MTTSNSVVEVHQGELIYRTAQVYPTLFRAALELVQNEIDAGANKVWIILNRKERDLIVRGNGKGASRAKFDRSLGSIGQSLKDLDQYGQFGYGLLSPT